MVPNPYTPGEIKKRGTATNTIPERQSCQEVISRENAQILDESLLKDLEEQVAMLRATSFFAWPADKLIHSCERSLESLADPLNSKRTRSKEPRTSRLHEIKPSPYEGKGHKEFDDFVHTLENIFLMSSIYYATERARALYACQYLRGTPKECWKQYTRGNDASDLSLTTFKGLP
jgi:hypothetical protein